MAIPNATEIKKLAGSIGELFKKGMTIEAQEKIMELREIVIELRELNCGYKDEIDKLKENNEIKEQLVYRENVYWRKLESGEEDGPFCQPCYDSKKMLVRLQKIEYDYLCNVCKIEVEHTHPPAPQSYNCLQD